MELKERTKDVANHSRTTLLEYGTHALKLVAALRALEIEAVDSLLGRVGLGRRQSSLRPLWWFAAGAMVGGGVVFVLAPSSGKELRERAKRFLRASKDVEVQAQHSEPEVSKKTNGADGLASPQGPDTPPEAQKRHT